MQEKDLPFERTKGKHPYRNALLGSNPDHEESEDEDSYDDASDGGSAEMMDDLEVEGGKKVTIEGEKEVSTQVPTEQHDDTSGVTIVEGRKGEYECPQFILSPAKRTEFIDLGSLV